MMELEAGPIWPHIRELPERPSRAWISEQQGVLSPPEEAPPVENLRNASNRTHNLFLGRICEVWANSVNQCFIAEPKEPEDKW